jgi:hypothetical protein
MVVARRGCGCATSDTADAVSKRTANARNRILVQCYIDTVLTIGAWALGLWLLHRFLSYAEGRGWIYYRKARGRYGGLGVTSNFLNMYDPSRRHLQEVVREVEWKRDEDDDGDDPEKKLRAALDRQTFR